MPQPIKREVKKTAKHIPKKKVPRQQKQKRKHQEYGTSKLEEKFAHNFLDKLGVEYVYQYKAESIGRYYDFYCPKSHILIEVDGVYWHSKGLLYEDMTPTQKRNKRVDEQKNHWALINGIPLLRIWEDDINNHPEKVMKLLREKLSEAKTNKEKEDKKKRRH